MSFTQEKLPELKKDLIVESSPAEVLELLKTSTSGLSLDEVKKRRDFFGLNKIEEVRKIPLFLLFLSNFIHFFALLLWSAALLSFVVGVTELGWAILAVIFINGVFSFFQEYKAEKATEALKKLLPSKVRVMRKKELEVEAEELVPGDIIFLGEGDKVPADIRLLEAYSLQVNNSTLTGESRPVRRQSEGFAFISGLSLTDCPNLVFAGTSIVQGQAKGVVFATGKNTEFGRIASLTQTIKEEPSPLQKEMVWVTKVVAFLAITMGIIFSLLGYFLTNLSGFDSFLFAIGIIVANVPEGLLPTVSLSLALGVQRMAEKNALVKKLSSVETLGSTTVICTDKTGTLTQNAMVVRNLFANRKHYRVTGEGYEPRGDFLIEGRAGEEAPLNSQELKQSLGYFFICASLCNNARLCPPANSSERWSIVGDPTEGALVVLAEKKGYGRERLKSEFRKIAENPFDSWRKRMSVIVSQNNRFLALVKGAPLEVLKLSEKVLIDGQVVDLDETLRKEIRQANDKYARNALRVLGLAYREVVSDEINSSAEEIEKNLIFLGLAAMMDPPRPEVEEAVKKCKEAGIKVIMVTGDYGLTAEAMARRVGLVSREARIYEGERFSSLTFDQLRDVVTQPDLIFARVSPEDKMNIVKALKENGEIVAVTGDGVNDAPALKLADIGVAMGIAGTDVAKEAAEMILLDDNFASIVNAVEEGRTVFANIKRFITYIFASNIPEIVPYLVFVLSGGLIPLPLTVLQILAVDLGTDMVPALALGAEPPEPGLLKKPPRSLKDRLLNKELLLRAYGFLGIIEATAGLCSYFFAYLRAGWRPFASLTAFPPEVYGKAITMCLAAIVAVQIGNGFACRSEEESIFKIGFFSNRFYLAGIATEMLLISLFVYLPFFQNLFGHRPLDFLDWLFLLFWAPFILLAEELRKAWLRKKKALK